MNASRLLIFPAIAAVLMLVASCAEEDMGIESAQAADGTEVAVHFNYTISDMSLGTRTVPADMESGEANDDGADIKVLNMWILQFSGNQPGSLLLGAPRFVSADDMITNPFSLPLAQYSDPCYTLFVANIAAGGQYEWNLSNESTFIDVIKKVKTLQAENDAYEAIGINDKTLLMSAVTTNAVITGATLSPAFTRNVAKVTLKLTLGNADMQILSVRLRNVSNTIVYGNAGLSKTGIIDTSVYPEDVVVMDYPAITNGLPTTDGVPVYFSWYVPRNQRGVNSSSLLAKDKTFYAPQGATYFEIIAKKMNGATTTATSVFRVYPGADQVSDYNIIPNKHYTVDLTVTDIGTDVADSRVETFADVDYTITGKTSNSFMLHPAPEGGSSRVYKIPIVQANRYWEGTTEGYGKDPAKVIGSSDKWAVSLIWSDLTNLFSTSGITLRANNGLGFGEGTGPNQWFELQVPAGLMAGNFTLGIKKTTGTGEYLWSWHFWVTDYNPDKFNPLVITNGIYTYPVPGGQVERYGAPVSGTDFWATAYADKVMMDRNLGAVENFFTTQPANANRGNLHYQFGRKDPFPASTLSGGVSIGFAAGPVPIKTTMSTPNVFYTVASGNWASDAISDSYQWNESNPSSGAKSIYDPCPPGWRMPANGTWNDFGRTISTGVYMNTQNSLRDLAWSYGRGMGTAVIPINGLRYWPGITATATTAGRIWYPAAGYRSMTTGLLTSVGSYGYYWSGTPYSATLGRYLYFYLGYVNPSYNSGRAYGFSVRCVAA